MAQHDDATDLTAYQGKNGRVEFGQDPLETQVALVTSWSYEESVDEYEKTAMGDAGKSYFGGIPEGTGSVECWMSMTDVAQVDVFTEMAAGDGATVTLFPMGDVAPFVDFSSTAVIIKSITVSADKDGIVTFSFTFRGKLTRTYTAT